MSQSTIRGAGYLYEANNLPSASSSTGAKQFLRKSAIEFSRLCAQYHRIINELPFISRERQIQSVLLPSIAKVADAVMAEQPVKRKRGNEFANGRIDYWVFYEPYVFLVEAKQSWQSVRSKRIRQDTKRAWSTALEQLRSISRKEIEQLSFSTKHIARIAWLIVPCYQASRYKDKLTPYNKQAAIDILNTLSGALQPVPNWAAAWAIHKHLQTNHEYEKERNEIYPYLFFLAHVLR